MSNICIEVRWSSGWMIFIAAWSISAAAAIWYWYHRQRPVGKDFFENRPSGTEKSSIVSWAFWIYSAWISQLSPNGALGRVIDPRYSRLYLDLYVLGWGTVALYALRLPE